MWDIALLKLWDWCTFIQSTLSYFAPPHESIMTKSVEVVQIFLEDIGPFCGNIGTPVMDYCRVRNTLS